MPIDPSNREGRTVSGRSDKRGPSSRNKPALVPVGTAGRKSGHPPPTKATGDIPACAALLNLRAVMLRPGESSCGWVVLAPINRSTGSAFVWRRASTAEGSLLDYVAGNRFVAGHWTARPGQKGQKTGLPRGWRKLWEQEGLA